MSPHGSSLFSETKLVQHTAELAGRSPHFGRRQMIEETLPRVFSPFRDGRSYTSQGVMVNGLRLLQLVDQRQHHVKLAHRPEPFRHLSKSAAQLPRRFRIEVEHGYQLPQAPRCDAGAVERAFVTAFHAGKDASEAAETVFEEV
jgi:hypothetical protein